MASRSSTRKPAVAQPDLSDKETPSPDGQTGGQGDPEFLQALEALSIPELNQVLKRAQSLRDGKLNSVKQDFMARMKAEGEQLGLNLDSLFGGAAPAKGLSEDNRSI